MESAVAFIAIVCSKHFIKPIFLFLDEQALNPYYKPFDSFKYIPSFLGLRNGKKTQKHLSFLISLRLSNSFSRFPSSHWTTQSSLLRCEKGEKEFHRARTNKGPIAAACISVRWSSRLRNAATTVKDPVKLAIASIDPQ